MAYVLHRSLDNPDELMFDELWVNKEALDSHLPQPNIKSALEQMKSILVEPVELRRYSEISIFDLLPYTVCSDLLAAVIPKELRKSLKLKKGDTLQAQADDNNGLLIYRER
jgi:antidote-toxin recognition MazE-like antitoxin/antibiotic biosynthesis monooxygenase